MKKIMIGSLALMLAVGTVEAQVKEHKAPNQKDHAMKQHQMKGKPHHAPPAFHKLNLTEAQKTQMKALHEQQRKEMQALKQNDQITVKAWREQRKAIHEKYKAQFQALLTPAQKEQLAKMKTQRNKHGFKPGGPEKGRFDGGKILEEKLNLTAEQKVKMEQIRAEAKAKAELIRSNNSLTQEQKRTQFQELMKQQKAQIQTVLNKEQLEKLETLRGQKRNRITK